MRIGVIGAGAMGGMFGGRFAEAGQDVVLVDANPDVVAAIDGAGLRLSGVGGDRRIAVPATTAPAGVDPVDLALITVDANHTRAAAETAAALLGDGVALTLQNGIGNVEALVDVLGADRVVAGVTMHSCAVTAPGEVAHTNVGGIWFGELEGRESDRVAALKGTFEAAGHDVTLVDDPQGWIWSKFLLNCAINPLSAATGLRQGHIARVPELDALQDRIVDEVLAVVAAKGLTLADRDVRGTVKRTTFLKYNKPSMLQHVAAGRRTEIDALNGALVREARALDVPVPTNEAIVAMIKGLENANALRAEGEDNVEALEAAAETEAHTRGLFGA